MGTAGEKKTIYCAAKCVIITGLLAHLLMVLGSGPSGTTYILGPPMAALQRLTLWDE